MTAEDSERALKALRQRAESGDAEAQVNIAAAAFLAPSFAAMILRRRARRGANQAAPDLAGHVPRIQTRTAAPKTASGGVRARLRLEPPRRSALNIALTSFVFGLAVGGCLGLLYATMEWYAHGLPVGQSFRAAWQRSETAARR